MEHSSFTNTRRYRNKVNEQSDSPVGMTKHGFNALNSNAVEGKAFSIDRLRLEKPRFHCAQLRRSDERIDQSRFHWARLHRSEERFVRDKRTGC